ncbi:MAG: ABC transporter substrate-binding protein [Candidatus Rokuibacteriota bacterium]
MHRYGLALVLLLAGAAAEAAPAGQPHRVGYLAVHGPASSGSPGLDALRRALAALGHVEGRTVVFEARHAEGREDRVPELLGDLLRHEPDAIVAEPATPALARVPRTVPIVTIGGDLLGTRLVASLVRPGGNVTGVQFVDAELAPARLDLLKKLAPDLRRVAVVTDWDTAASELKPMGPTANNLGVYAEAFMVRKPEDLAEVFDQIGKKHFNGLLVVGGPLLAALRPQLLALTLTQRLPAIGPTGFAEAGGTLAYGPPPAEIYRPAAALLHRILEGAKPRDLAAERPSRFELVINARAARDLGLTVPASLRRRSGRVIE